MFDGHDGHINALEQQLEGEGEVDSLRVLGEELREPGLVDRDLAPLQRRDLVLVDVPDRHLEAQRGEADAGDQADVARPDDADALAAAGPAAGRRPLRPLLVHGVEPSSSTETSVSVRPFFILGRGATAGRDGPPGAARQRLPRDPQRVRRRRRRRPGRGLRRSARPRVCEARSRAARLRHRTPQPRPRRDRVGHRLRGAEGAAGAGRGVRRGPARGGERADALGAGAQRRAGARAPRARPPAGPRRHAPGVPGRRPGLLAARRRAGHGRRRRRPGGHRRRGGRGGGDDHLPQPRPALHQGVRRALELRRPASLGRPDRRRPRGRDGAAPRAAPGRPAVGGHGSTPRAWGGRWAPTTSS